MTHLKMLQAEGAEWIQDKRPNDLLEKMSAIALIIEQKRCCPTHYTNIFELDSDAQNCQYCGKKLIKATPFEYRATLEEAEASEEINFWLPSLEDYLGMLEGTLEETLIDLMTTILHPDDYYGYIMHDYFRQFSTWPEIGLAFVMQVKKGLNWDGERWVK